MVMTTFEPRTILGTTCPSSVLRETWACPIEVTIGRPTILPLALTITCFPANDGMWSTSAWKSRCPTWVCYCDVRVAFG